MDGWMDRQSEWMNLFVEEQRNIDRQIGRQLVRPTNRHGDIEEEKYVVNEFRGEFRGGFVLMEK